MGCEICGSPTKNPTSRSHIKTKKHQAALRGGTGQIVSTPTRSVSRGAIPTEFVNRLSDLEKQMRYVIDKLGIIEGRLSSSSSTDLGLNLSSQIKSEIIRMTRRGTSISLDDLAKKLSKYRWDVVEKAIREMIDDELFDVAEAFSKKKINGRYGRIIRR